MDTRGNHINNNVTAPNLKRVGKRDQQLIIILMCEVLLYVSTNLLYSINITYSAITSGEAKSIDRIHIESFIAYFSTPFLIIINNCAPFYLYLIVSSKFRQDVRNFLSFCYHYHQQVTPQQADLRSRGMDIIAT
jgi:hypothetical protein